MAHIMSFNSLFAQTSEIASVNIMIDRNESSLVALCCNKYKLKSKIRAVKAEGGDDDGHGIKGFILLPPHAKVDSIILIQPFLGENLKLGYTQSNSVIEFISNALITNDSSTLRDSIIIEVDFKITNSTVSKVSVSVGAYALSPGESHPLDNYWTSDIITTNPCRIRISDLMIPRLALNTIDLKKVNGFRADICLDLKNSNKYKFNITNDMGEILQEIHLSKGDTKIKLPEAIKTTSSMYLEITNLSTEKK